MTTRLRSGLELLDEVVGTGPPVERHAYYQIRRRIWLRQGDPVRWPEESSVSHRVEDDGTTWISWTRVDRISMSPGVFHGVQGMRVGGTRRQRISPHLASGEAGVPGLIPANAVLTVEVTILSDVFPAEDMGGEAR